MTFGPEWTPAEDMKIRLLYPSAPRYLLLGELGGRTYRAIMKRAGVLGVAREVFQRGRKRKPKAVKASAPSRRKPQLEIVFRKPRAFDRMVHPRRGRVVA